MAKKKKPSFEEYYAEIYPGRWEALKQAFQQEKVYRTLNRDMGFQGEYHLDDASFTCAKALNPKPGDRVLDLCAAPGGKSLSLAYFMDFKGKLTCNDRSASRRGRLRNVLESLLPVSESFEFKVTGHDAAKWLLYEKNSYDKILLDAPCSSEEHVLASPKHLHTWTPNRTKKLAQAQYAMLLSALEVVKANGYILYSTCSISPLENDGVIERVIKKRPGRLEVQSIEMDYGESTDFGYALFPDKTGGKGPIYLSLLKRLE